MNPGHGGFIICSVAYLEGVSLLYILIMIKDNDFYSHLYRKLCYRCQIVKLIFQITLLRNLLISSHQILTISIDHIFASSLDLWNRYLRVEDSNAVTIYGMLVPFMSSILHHATH